MSLPIIAMPYNPYDVHYIVYTILCVRRTLYFIFQISNAVETQFSRILDIGLFQHLHVA